jgi:hypothetical protein
MPTWTSHLPQRRLPGRSSPLLYAVPWEPGFSRTPMAAIRAHLAERDPNPKRRPSESVRRGLPPDQ